LIEYEAKKSKKRAIVAAIAAAVLVPLIILSCTAEADPPPGVDPPVIHGLQAESERVFPSESIQIMCTASSFDGGELSYEWWASGGAIDGQGSTAAWTAPASDGTYTVGVIVTDSGGRGATSHVTIAVQTNQAPAIISLVANPDWTVGSGSVSIACIAEDPDGHSLSYQWSTSGGQIEGTGSEVTWTAPEQLGEYSVTVVVTDEYDAMDTKTLQISVMPQQPPVIEALHVTANHRWLRERSFGYQVGYAQEYSIECVASHPEGSELHYEWTYNGGEMVDTSEDGSTVTWLAPSTSMYVTVTVTVFDTGGNAATTSVDFEVIPCWT
jgi:hypothetical protein